MTKQNNYKSIFIAIVCIIFCCSALQEVKGQNWLPQDSGTREGILEVYFVDDLTGVAVGRRGTILRTENGGNVWSLITSGTNNDLHDIFFVNFSNGYAVGQNGTILHTNNAGLTWMPQFSGQTGVLISCSFTDVNTGWIVGQSGTIIHTEDGGTTWNPEISGTNNTLNGVAFLDQNYGLAIGNSGVILKYNGNNWNQQDIGQAFWLGDLSIVDANEAFTSGHQGTVLETNDGGQTWAPQTSNTSNNLHDIYFVNNDFGTAVGKNGTVIHTEDAGNTWIHQTSGVNERLEDVFFVNKNSGWIVGVNGTILTHCGDPLTTQNTLLGIPQIVVDFEGDVLPSLNFPAFQHAGNITNVSVSNNVLRIIDNDGIQPASFFRRDSLPGGSYAEMVFRLRVHSSTGFPGVRAQFIDGNKKHINLGINTNSIGIRDITSQNDDDRRQYYLDATQWHTYKLVKNYEEDIQVFIDCFTEPVLTVSYDSIRVIDELDSNFYEQSFGAGSIEELSNSEWDFFRYRIILPNQPPVADAGKDSTYECSSPTGSSVSLNGFNSSDPDDDQLTYTWRENGIIIAGPTPDQIFLVTLSLGSHEIELTGDDGNGGIDLDTVVIDVVDTEPPVITVNANPLSFWPPNHKYETISVQQGVVSVFDVCDVDLLVSDVLIASVSSDEPEDVKGNGDGKTLDDIVISDDCKSAQLRKERQGGGNGRVYTIHFEAVDHSGNPATASYQVQVPHDKKDMAMDDGPAYTVQGNCSIPSALIASDIEENLDGKNDGENKFDEKQLTTDKKFEDIHDLSETELPNGYQLYQNHPNPFNPTTEISFALPQAVNVRLEIYNLSGQLVRTLVSGQLPAGVHRVTWNATDGNGIRVASGMYLYVLKAGQHMDKKKLLLMK